MERSPPPIFNQGVSAHARLLLCAGLAIALLVIDSRLQTLSALRQGAATLLYPLQRALLAPRDLLRLVGEHIDGIERLRQDNTELRRLEAANARALLQAEQVADENRRMRELLGARERSAIPSVIAEVLSDSRDPFSRRILIDKGLQQGLIAGQPVISAQGVIGQVTRVLPLSAEVTLLTDRGAAVPVAVARTGQRAIAFGGADGLLELRFVAASSDIKPGDGLVTSGLDGIYPAGLPVATVERIEAPGAAGAFGLVLARPVAMPEQQRLMLVLLVERHALPPPPAEPAPADARRRRPAP
ncbi:MAG: rod shape-determining protein MreC [Betaproteobacteria bacterium]|nr:rod shape-determining protein MreC [Betaproteobacteria bacterium]